MGEIDIQLLRKNNSPEITPWYDAMVHYMCLGNCIYSGIMNSCKPTIDAASGTFTVDTGMGQALGYQFRITGLSTLSIPSSSYLNFSATHKVNTVGILLYVDGSDESKDTMTLEFRESSSLVPDKTEIIKDGTSTSGSATYIPLWTITSYSLLAFAETISLMEPAIAKNAENLTSSGKLNGVSFSSIFNNFWSLSTIKKDYEGNAVDMNITQKPGALYADHAGIASVCTHIGANESANHVDANLMTDSGGYLPQITPLFSYKDISSTTDTPITFLNSLPSHCVSIVFVGRTGVELMRTGPASSAGGSTFYLDSYSIDNHHYRVALASDGKSLTVYAPTGDLTDLFNADEFTRVEAYAVSTLKDIF